MTQAFVIAPADIKWVSPADPDGFLAAIRAMK
jgi:hypothetical protein